MSENQWRTILDGSVVVMFGDVVWSWKGVVCWWTKEYKCWIGWKKIDKQETGLNWDRIFYSSGNLSYEEYSRTVSERKCKFMEYSYDSLCKKK